MEQVRMNYWWCEKETKGGEMGGSWDVRKKTRKNHTFILGSHMGSVFAGKVPSIPHHFFFIFNVDI